MKPWKLVGKPEKTKVGWRVLLKKTFLQPNDKEEMYTTIGEKGARHGAVIALTEDNKVVVAEQFRPGPEMVMQELPGGNIEEGEDPQAATLRELREEVGYASENVTFLGKARKDAYMNAIWYYYLARDCKKVHDQALDDTEFIDIRQITIDELIANAKSDKMTDAPAVLMAYDDLMKIKEGK